MSSLHVSKNLEERLIRLSERTHKSKDFYVKRALESFLEEKEDYLDAVASYEEYLHSGIGYTLADMKQRHNLE
jgi:RHH-type rel operon transcriptional repressor/antitoxin RelB